MNDVKTEKNSRRPDIKDGGSLDHIGRSMIRPNRWSETLMRANKVDQMIGGGQKEGETRPKAS